MKALTVDIFETNMNLALLKEDFSVEANLCNLFSKMELETKTQLIEQTPGIPRNPFNFTGVVTNDIVTKYTTTSPQTLNKSHETTPNVHDTW